MIIDRTPIRAADPFVAFCGRCGLPMRVCQGLCARRAVVAQAQREPPVADAPVADAPPRLSWREREPLLWEVLL